MIPLSHSLSCLLIVKSIFTPYSRVFESRKAGKDIANISTVVRDIGHAGALVELVSLGFTGKRMKISLLDKDKV